LEYILIPRLLENVPTKAKKVYNDGDSIAYIDVDDVLWWSQSNPKYARPHLCTFRKVINMKIKDFTCAHNHYYVIDLDNNVWRGQTEDFYDNRNLSVPVITKVKAKRMVAEDSYLACASANDTFFIIDMSKEKLLCSHKNVTYFVMNYEKAVFLDKNSNVWVYTIDEKKKRSFSIKSSCISLNAFIDLNNDVHEIIKGTEGILASKVEGVKGVRLDSSRSGNCVIMGRRI